MRTTAFTAFALFFPPSSYAEASFTVLSVPGLWTQAVLIGAVAILAGWLRWWIGVPFLILPIFLFLSTFGSRHMEDRFPAIIEEHGYAWFQHSYSSSFLTTIMVLLGIWIGWWRRKSRQQISEQGKRL
jgi:hypothetical protein